MRVHSIHTRTHAHTCMCSVSLFQGVVREAMGLKRKAFVSSLCEGILGTLFNPNSSLHR